jgi:hypothetical protein
LACCSARCGAQAPTMTVDGNPNWDGVSRSPRAAIKRSR